MPLTHSEFLARPLNQDWLIKDFLPPSGVAVLYGDAKIGKSYLAIQLALALIGETPSWLGFPIDHTGPVLYIQLDTSPPVWQDRFVKLGVEGKGLYHDDLLTLDVDAFNILDPEHFSKLRAAVDKVRPVAVFIDTLREAHDAEENDSTTMKRAMSALIAAVYPSTLIVITHSRKPSSEGGHSITTEARGSNYLPGKVDVIAWLRGNEKRAKLEYKGRAVEKGTKKLVRVPSGFWELVPDQGPLAPSELSDSARAAQLAEEEGISQEAARSRLRRAKKRR